MRNISSKHIRASEIINTIVTASVKQLFYSDFKKALREPYENKVNLQMHQVHLYLNSHMDILFKKNILFTHNDNNQHWWGWVAINPWCFILKVVQKQKFVKERM